MYEKVYKDVFEVIKTIQHEFENHDRFLNSSRVALRVAEMRSKRLGIEFTVGDIARLGIELLYAGGIGYNPRRTGEGLF